MSEVACEFSELTGSLNVLRCLLVGFCREKKVVVSVLYPLRECLF